MRAAHRMMRRRTGPLFGLLAIAVLGLSGCSGSAPVGQAPSSPTTPPAASLLTTPAAAVTEPTTGSAAPATNPAGSPTPTATAQAVPSPLVLPAAAPVTLTIPAINVISPLPSLGRNPDGTVEVPSLDDPDAGAGWFRDSPAPGSLGPSVILGHVDSRQFGPGVFYDLGNLRPGNTVEIARDDGTVAVFAVDSVETVPKADFPTLQVYGNIGHAGLRLITCGGSFDESARSYENNVIAFASLISSRPA